MNRLNRKYETEAEWLMKQQKWAQMEPTLPSNYDFEDDLDQPLTGASSPGNVAGFTSGVDRTVSSPRRRKDEKMAEDDPMRYCADRCVTTGNCDVFEVRKKYCCNNFTALHLVHVMCDKNMYTKYIVCICIFTTHTI